MDPLTLALGAGSILSSLWGKKKDNSNMQKQLELARQQREQSLAFIREQMGQAQNNLMTYFPQAQQSRQQGYNAAMGLMGSTFQPMLDAYQGGNMMAQQALLSGLPQQNNAILGGPLNYNFAQPQRIQIDPRALAGLTNPAPLNFAPMGGSNV